MAAAAMTPRSLDTFFRPASLPGVRFMESSRVRAYKDERLNEAIVNHGENRGRWGLWKMERSTLRTEREKCRTRRSQKRTKENHQPGQPGGAVPPGAGV